MILCLTKCNTKFTFFCLVLLFQFCTLFDKKKRLKKRKGYALQKRKDVYKSSKNLFKNYWSNFKNSKDIVQN